mgnify:CR=1 FL=1
MSSFLCSLRAFAKRREDKMSPEDKTKLHDEMLALTKEWDSGKIYKNVQDAKWNNAETFEWLWEKYTHKSLDPSQNPPNFKDLRKFKFGLKYYNNLIGKKDGLIWSKFHLPRAAMQNIPELKKFETDLIKETSFFRDYTTATNKQVNDFLTEFKELGLSLGEPIERMPGVRSFSSAGQKAIKKIQDDKKILDQKLLTTKNLIEKNKIKAEISKNQEQLKMFYENGAGRAFEILNSVLQGANIETIDLKGVKLTNKQKNHLYNIKKNMNLIRTSGVTGLIKGLQKIKQMAKDKNLVWVDGTVDKINSMIKRIEFQHRIDKAGKTIDYKDMVDDRQFLALGFKPDSNSDMYSSSDRKLSFSPHYMSKYTGGMLGLIKKLETAVDRADLSLDKKLELELNRFNDVITDVAKPRSAIIDNFYDNDPYFFLKKYVSDVGIFNYKTHVKSTFKKAVDTITNEHLNPSREAGRKDLEESAMGMLDLLNDTYKEIEHIDPRQEGYFTDAVRALTSVTYFRLMGGNIRSAARNATQRLYEFVEFGAKAKWDARNWYKNSGSSEDNMTRLIRQQKKRGIQWYDGKSKTSSIFGKDESGMLSEQSRGAIEDAYNLDKDMYVDKNGELQIKEKGERVTEFVARKAGEGAVFAGKAHKIVEDWNRAGTFKTAFALAMQNLEASDRTWLSKKVLGKQNVNKIMSQKGEDYVITYDDVQRVYGDKHEKVFNDWVENEAGQIAYNATVDLHFEYSKWAKAKAIRIRGDESGATQLAKAGLGQFAHYRFNLMNMMYNWGKEAGISWGARDFTSQESWKMLRFGALQVMVGSAFIPGGGLGMMLGMDIAQLANNDVIDTGEKMYAWLSANKEKFEEGEVSKETQEWLDEITYGQGFGAFLGPNFPLAASTYEFLTHTTLDNSKDARHEWKNGAFKESVKRSINRNDNKELYDKIAVFNSQIARSYAYTSSAYKAGGIPDAILLESGFFQNKEEREWTHWFKEKIGFDMKKKKKKKWDSGLTRSQRQRALSSLGRLGG